MRAVGIDVGSRFVKVAILEDGGPPQYSQVATGYDPLAACAALLAPAAADRVLATGYGRHLLEVQRTVPTVTEIKAFARGAKAAIPGCRAVIDVGGQDTKVIAMRHDGKVARFEMNDRCAAGTGRFLEVMAERLGFSIEEFGAAADDVGTIQLSSLCTVFAESEIVGLIGRGVDRRAIAGAVHRAVATRVGAMANRLPLEDPVVFAGGGARNRLLGALLGRRLAKELVLPPAPEMLGALGAALLAAETDP